MRCPAPTAAAPARAASTAKRETGCSDSCGPENAREEAERNDPAADLQPDGRERADRRGAFSVSPAFWGTFPPMSRPHATGHRSACPTHLLHRQTDHHSSAQLPELMGTQQRSDSPGPNCLWLTAASVTA